MTTATSDCDVIKTLGELTKGSTKTRGSGRGGGQMLEIKKRLYVVRGRVRPGEIRAGRGAGHSRTDTDCFVRQSPRNASTSALEVATALRQIEPTDPAAREIIPLVVEILASKRKDLHIRAATVAGLFGPAAAGAVPGLIAMLHRSTDDISRVRHSDRGGFRPGSNRSGNSARRPGGPGPDRFPADEEEAAAEQPE